jgi:DNA-binding transcriptional MocR family regulator
MHALVRFAARDLHHRARRAGVQVKSADAYYLSGTSPNELIIGFSATGERALTEGVKRLARAGYTRGSS